MSWRVWSRSTLHKLRACKCSSIQQICTGRARPLLTSVASSQKQPPGDVDESPAVDSEEPWPSSEVLRWDLGRKKLAAIMGADPESFSEKDVSEALRYLLPTRLTAADAQPLLKHPSRVFDKRKESAFDATGRPLEPAFYTGFPAYHNLIYKIFQMNQYLESQQPDQEEEGRGKEERGKDGREEEGVRRSEVPKFWVKRKTLANIISEEVSEVQYRDVVSRLARLACHPRAHVITDFLDQFRRPHYAHHISSQHPQVTSRGQVRTVGRRKSSVAVVYLKQGEGEIVVNSEPLLSYFPLLEQRQQVLFPLVATRTLGTVDVSSQVRGGGKTGQAGAIRLAISKALLGLPGQHQEVLEEAGLLVRDPRTVERKKPGQKKARKKFAWVKR